MHLDLPFAGRDQELRAVLELLEGNSRGAVVTGPPGIGKSRLATEVAARERGSVATVRATTASREIPFGAVAPLLGELLSGSRLPDDPVEVLALAARTLDATFGADLLLVVDDIHALDPASAVLVHQLTTNHTARLLATTRDDETVPDEVVALAREGLLGHVTLGPLDHDAIGVIAHRALGGPIDSVLRRRLIGLVDGNALHLREVLLEGLATGRLEERDGRWCWTGELSAGRRLGPLLGSRLAGLDDSIIEAVRYVALCEPVGVAVLEQLVDPAAIEAAEAGGYLMIETTTRRREIRVAHSLYTDAVLSECGTQLRRRMSCALAEALRVAGTNRVDDDLRCARFEMECGRATDPSRLLRAARRSRSFGDLASAERFALAAVDADAGPEAVNDLADILVWEGKFEQLLDFIALVDTRCSGGDARAQLELHRSTALLFATCSIDSALAAVRDAVDLVESAPMRCRVAAHEAELLMFGGRLADALVTATRVLRSPDASPLTRAVAYGAIVPSLALRGDIEGACSTALEWWDAIDADEDTAWEGAGVLVGSWIAALLDPGCCPVDDLVSVKYAESLPQLGDPLAGIWAALHGRTLLARGDVALAEDVLTDAASLLEAHDPGRFRAFGLAALARARAMRGDHQGAARALAELDQLAIPSGGAIEVEIVVGRAWVDALAGRQQAAVAALLDYTDDLARAGSLGASAHALLHAFRLGAGASDLEVRAPKLAGVRCLTAEVVMGLTRNASDADGLIELARVCADRDRSLWAAEIGSFAMAVLEVGDPRRARLSVLVSAWRERCPGARTPLLDAAASGSPECRLTARERDVARLVAEDLSNPEIGARLFVSRRTVESHLARVYTKLGITSRHELAALMRQQQ